MPASTVLRVHLAWQPLRGDHFDDAVLYHLLDFGGCDGHRGLSLLSCSFFNPEGVLGRSLSLSSGATGRLLSATTTTTSAVLSTLASRGKNLPR